MALKRSFFSIPGVGTAIGLKSDGRTLADLRPDNAIIKGRIGSLRRFKDDVSEVKVGLEEAFFRMIKEF